MKSLLSNDLAVLWFYTWRNKSYRVKFSFIWRRYLHRAWTLKVWYDEHTEPNIWLNSSLENQQICAGKVAIMLIHYSQNVKWNSDDSFINLKLAMSISNGVRLAGWVGQQAFSEWSGDKWDLAETWLEPEEERDIPNRRRLPSMGGLLNLGGFPCLAFESSTFLNFPTNKFVTEEGCLPSLVYLIFPWLAGIFILQRLLWFKTSS